MTQSMEELIERAMNATGPDQELDRLLTEALDYPHLARMDDGTIPFHAQCARFTSSVDLGLVLMDRTIPDWFVSSIGEDFTFPPKSRIGWTVELEKVSAVEEGIFQGQAPTLPLAVILALLTALNSKASP